MATLTTTFQYRMPNNEGLNYLSGNEVDETFSPVPQDSDKDLESLKKSNSEQPEFCEDFAVKEEKQLSSDAIQMLLEVSPEIDEIDGLLDARCYTLHKDEKLACFSEAFKTIIKENENLFSNKSSLDKAEILFNFHSHAATFLIIQSEKLSSLVDSFFNMLEGSYKTEKTKSAITSEITKKLKERIINLHSNYVRIAIADALKEPFENIQPISFSVVKNPEVKMPSNIMNIYS